VAAGHSGQFTPRGYLWDCQHCDTHYFSGPRTRNLPIVGWLLVRRATSSATDVKGLTCRIRIVSYRSAWVDSSVSVWSCWWWPGDGWSDQVAGDLTGGASNAADVELDIAIDVGIDFGIGIGVGATAVAAVTDWFMNATRRRSSSNAFACSQWCTDSLNNCLKQNSRLSYSLATDTDCFKSECWLNDGP